MQIESGLAPSLGEASVSAVPAVMQPALQTVSQPHFNTQIHNITQLKPSAAKLDRISASVVIGLTAQFVTSVFGIVTEFLPRMFEIILLSTFIGMCVGVIAFALMSESHDEPALRRQQESRAEGGSLLSQ